MHKWVSVSLCSPLLRPPILKTQQQNMHTTFPFEKCSSVLANKQVFSPFLSLNKKKHYIFELITRGVTKIQKIKSLNCNKISDTEKLVMASPCFNKEIISSLFYHIFFHPANMFANNSEEQKLWFMYMDRHTCTPDLLPPFSPSAPEEIYGEQSK